MKSREEGGRLSGLPPLLLKLLSFMQFCGGYKGEACPGQSDGGPIDSSMFVEVVRQEKVHLAGFADFLLAPEIIQDIGGMGSLFLRFRVSPFVLGRDVRVFCGQCQKVFPPAVRLTYDALVGFRNVVFDPDFAFQAEFSPDLGGKRQMVGVYGIAHVETDERGCPVRAAKKSSRHQGP